MKSFGLIRHSAEPPDSSCPLLLRDVPRGICVALLPRCRMSSLRLYTTHQCTTQPQQGPRPRSSRFCAHRNLAFRSDNDRPPSNDDSRSRRSHDGVSDRRNGLIVPKVTSKDLGRGRLKKFDKDGDQPGKVFRLGSFLVVVGQLFVIMPSIGVGNMGQDTVLTH